MQVLLGPDQADFRPQCVRYSRELKKLYVACTALGNAGVYDSVKVFDVKVNG